MRPHRMGVSDILPIVARIRGNYKKNGGLLFIAIPRVDI